MTETTMRPSQGSGRQGIPGISAAELYVMRAAAARFLGSQDTGTVTGDMRVLRVHADSQAAGTVSRSRNLYKRMHGTHFMAMPHDVD